MGGGFPEAELMHVKLPNAEPEAFDGIQIWLYRRRVFPAKVTETDKMKHLDLAKLWVYGDAHDMPALQNASINLLHQLVIARWQVPTTKLR